MLNITRNDDILFYLHSQNKSGRFSSRFRFQRSVNFYFTDESEPSLVSSCRYLCIYSILNYTHSVKGLNKKINLKCSAIPTALCYIFCQHREILNYARGYVKAKLAWRWKSSYWTKRRVLLRSFLLFKNKEFPCADKEQGIYLPAE